MKAFNKILLILLTITSWSCVEDEFEQATVTIVNSEICPVAEGSDQFVTINLFTSQKLREEGTITIDLQEEAVQTTPSANGRYLTLTIPAGEDNVKFNISYGEDNVEENKIIPVIISSVGGGIQSVGQGLYTLHVINNDNPRLQEDFNALCENDNESLTGRGWTVYSVKSGAEWVCTAPDRGASESTGDNGYEMSNYNSSPSGEGADDWLITPKLILFDAAQINFNSLKRYAGSTVTVLYSSNYISGEDPTEYTWVEHQVATDAFDDNENSWTYAAAENINLGIIGQKHIAFRVTSTGTASGGASTIRVDDILITNAALSPECRKSEGGGSGGGGDIPVTVNAPYAETFNACADGAVTGWAEFSMSSNNNWECTDDTRGATGEAGDYAKEMSGYNADGASEDWLISPGINLGTGDNYVNFKSTVRYAGGNLEVFYSTDYTGTGDPSEASWTSFTAANNALDNNVDSWDYIPSGDIDISFLSGKVYIAFVYTSTGPGSAEAGTVRLDDFQITGSGGGGGGGATLAFPFSTDFEGCTTNFSTPDLFIEAFAAGSQTDRGWGCREFGVDDSRAVRASAFKSSSAEEGYDNAWLITEAPIDMSSASDVYIHFMVSSMYGGPGTIKLKWSENYSGSGDPSGATWAEIDISSQLPAAGSNAYNQVTVNASDLAGTEAYIAIQYIDALASSAASWDIDNFEVTDSATPGF